MMLVLMATILSACTGPSDSEIASCMRYNQTKYDDYSAMKATKRANLMAKVENAQNSVESALGLGSRRHVNENAAKSCSDHWRGCASPDQFRSECSANPTFIWVE
jgi:hypothetical protein